MIPNRMSFFWSGGPMSWMRYLTLLSFKTLNPRWEVRLRTGRSGMSRKPWVDPNPQDFFRYTGKDYLPQVEKLGIKVAPWDFGDTGRQNPQQWSPVQQSDVFQWQVLSGSGGLYADMDVLFVKPMSAMPGGWHKSDLLFCIKDKHFPIGFLGSSGNSRFFRDVRKSAITKSNEHGYATAGVEAVYRVLRGKPVNMSVTVVNRRRSNAQRFVPGKHSLVAVLSQNYKESALCNLPVETIYPFVPDELDKLFTAGREQQLPPTCMAVHWYGGAKIAQGFNCKLTEQTLNKYPCLFSQLVKDVLRKARR